ncbi:acyltransferase family protein [Streptomyces sp. JJ36]|uniref:acyltransferase family protein n=1 Tax=Streptomyces sp. JJ36 TaxID=2736645 RepID=UPI001F1ACCBE|nr:acyltransferase family protein [Streptomyces sp. JJ36]
MEGLRALAVGAVLAYHAGVNTFGGGYVGVDVFFVISGFLITGVLLRELERSGTLSLRRFYARRMRRLLPLTVVVLSTVVLLASWLMSPVQRKGVFEDVIASALYVVNWQQAQQAVDYSAAGTEASPVQHFWSLAVEEQFYLVWPLVLLAVCWWCRRGRRREDHLDGRTSERLGAGPGFRRRLALVLGALTVASFGYAVLLTAREGGAAYFSTAARGWELAVGGLLALVPAPRLRPRRVSARSAATVLGAAGLAAVLGAVVWYGEDTPFPGTAALLPVLGTAAVIAAGAVAADSPVGRLLTLRPVRYVGRISYSWYLWHWPALVFATVWLGDLPTSLALAVVVLSWVPAALTHELVENYFRGAPRFAPTGAALRLGMACTLVSVLVAALPWSRVPTVPLASPEQVKGAKALEEDPTPQQRADALRPVPAEATKDKGKVHADGCLVPQRDTESPDCVYGDPASGTTVVLFGDSHAMQYAPALEQVAERRGWRLVVLTKSACTPAETTTYNPQFKREYTECGEWRSRAMERIEEESPSLVITGNRATTKAAEAGKPLDRKRSAEAVRDGFTTTLRALRDTGASVVTLADNPHPPEDIPSCVSNSLERLTECAFDERVGRGFERVNAEAAEELPDVELVDPLPVLCPDGTCPAVIGNALVYRNGAHITATYMETLGDWLDEALPQTV